MIDIACLIVGIDGWDRYTWPLIRSLKAFEPHARITCIDNASAQPYPANLNSLTVQRTPRLSYATAIMAAAERAESDGGLPDWYLVLSNDVRCTGPFRHLLGALTNVVAGPKLMSNIGYEYIEGWCVATPRNVWQAVGGWDVGMLMSSWEDVEHSQAALERGYTLHGDDGWPFIHLDQRQRFALPGYGGSEGHNYARMVENRRRYAEAVHA